jgi:hypothetical protein
MNVRDNKELRQMTAYERAILDRLLSVEFEGVEAARQQAETALAWSVDDDGCFDFEAPDGPDISSPWFILSEGAGPEDAQSVPVMLMLFQRQGRLGGVEFVRFGGDPNHYPQPSEWAVAAYVGTPTVGTARVGGADGWKEMP